MGPNPTALCPCKKKSECRHTQVVTCEDTRKGATEKPRTEASGETNAANILSRDFQPSEL
jgi:hypothetical protein